MANKNPNPATRFSSANQPAQAGRPREARDRLSRAFLTGLADDFEKNGVEAIEVVRRDDPAAYLRVVASLQPKELEVSDPLRTMSDEKLAQVIETLAGEIRDLAPTPTPRNKTEKPKPTVN